MKEDLNIEQLFKQKFENFEGNVDPSAWANISQGLNAAVSTGAAVTGTGLGIFGKVAIIVGVATVTTLGIWYFTDQDTPQNNQEDHTTVVNNKTGRPENKETDSVLNNDGNNNDVEESHQTNENSPSEENGSDNSDHQANTGVQQPDGDGVIQDEMPHLQGPDENMDNKEKNPNKGDYTKTESDQPKEEKVPDATAQPIFRIIGGNKVEFISNADNYSNVSWEFGDGKVKSGEAVVHEYARPGKYQVTAKVTDKKGKINSYSLEVAIKGTSEISKVPNDFTPNGDNANDFYFIESKGIVEFQIYIMDAMTGDIVFESQDADFRWYGENKNGTGTVKQGNYRCMIVAKGEDGMVHKEVKTIYINY